LDRTTKGTVDFENKSIFYVKVIPEIKMEGFKWILFHLKIEFKTRIEFWRKLNLSEKPRR
jgi:hypothetical protein